MEKRDKNSEGMQRLWKGSDCRKEVTNIFKKNKGGEKALWAIKGWKKERKKENISVRNIYK